MLADLWKTSLSWDSCFSEHGFLTIAVCTTGFFEFPILSKHRCAPKSRHRVPSRMASNFFAQKKGSVAELFLSHAMRVGRKVFIELHLSQFNIWSVPQTNWHGTWKCFFTNQLLLGSMLMFVGVVSWSYYRVHRGRSGKNDVNIRLAPAQPQKKEYSSHLNHDLNINPPGYLTKLTLILMRWL